MTDNSGIPTMVSDFGQFKDVSFQLSICKLYIRHGARQIFGGLEWGRFPEGLDLGYPLIFDVVLCIFMFL